MGNQQTQSKEKENEENKDIKEKENAKKEMPPPPQPENNQNENDQIRREDEQGVQRVQVGQVLELRRNERYIGIEKWRLEKGHPPRIPKQLSHTIFGRWAVEPRNPTLNGKLPRHNS